MRSGSPFRGISRASMPPCDGSIGANGTPAPDDKGGPIEVSNRVAFPTGERGEPSIDG